METKTFGDKKITIRKLSKNDLKNVKKFQNFINSLVNEEAKILMNKKNSFKEEQDWLKGKIKDAKKHREVLLVAEYDSKIIGTTGIGLDRWRRNHIGKFGITIIHGYRGIGLGKYLMSEVIRLAKKELNPKPKIIQLEVYTNNKPAINLYKKMGFKIVAKLPKQIQYKGKLIDEFVMLKYL
jgi:RimJ/RimL family protein N-acetyltransferase